MNAIVITVRFLLRNIKKIFLVLALAIIFVVLLFPLGDLNDLISSQVSKLSRSQVYFQFDNMHLNPFTATVTMDNALIDSPQLAGLNIESLSISPALSNLYNKPGGVITANGILKGDIEVSMSPSNDKSKIEFSATNISLKELRETASLPLPISGQLNLTSQALADLSFAEQPEMDLTLLINNFEMPSGNINLQQMGSVSLPLIKFEKIELKGKLSNGKFLIESGKLGTSKDDFYGDIKGDMALSFKSENNQIYPVFGGYSISLDLKANADFQQRATLFLSFLDGYKVPGSNPANYKVTVSAENLMGAGLRFSPLR